MPPGQDLQEGRDGDRLSSVPVAVYKPFQENLLKPKIVASSLLFLLLIPAAAMSQSTSRGVTGGEAEIQPDATNRLRRGVTWPLGAPTTLKGRVIAAATGQPVESARIDVRNNSAMSDEEGRFTIQAHQGTQQVVVTRVGFARLTQSVTLGPGTNELEFRLSPGATAVLRTTEGLTYTIDYEATEFGYVVPFVGYQGSRTLKLCVNGQERDVQVEQLARVSGPAQMVSSGSCCSFDQAQQISLVLRSGEQVTGIMTDSCQGSKMDVMTWDRTENKSIFVPLAKVQEIVFPAE